MTETLVGLRCPVCGASDWLDRQWSGECSHCRLIVASASVLPGVADEVADRLAQDMVDLVDRPADGWWTDAAGMRNLAWRFGYSVASIDGRRVQPGEAPARMVAARATPVPHHVALAVMARKDDRRADDLMAGLAPVFRRRMILLDGGDPASHAERFPGATVACHPLGGDFAAQRNRLQAMAGHGWVLQIDTDERPDDVLLAALGWLTAAADRDGLRSLGLPRRNYVDGTLSASYPDIQYRLNRADVRFVGRVHERPDVPFAQTSLALVGAIKHRISAARVRERTRVYEAMSAGAGRPEDERLLLRPFDPIAIR